MCGILAGSGIIDPKIISALGCLNAERGTDSSGIAWYEGDRIWFRKMASHPSTAFTIELAESIVRAVKSGVIIGHTRAATTGAVNDENAHPFTMDGYAFAHNGVIQNHKEFGTYKVDSQALIHGIKDKDFSKYVGSVALVWLDGLTLYAYRKGNPLFRGVTKGGGTYLASSNEHLKAVGCEKIRPLAEGHLYEIKEGKIVNSKKIPANKTTSGIVYHQSWNGYDGEAVGYQPWWKREQELDEIEKNATRPSADEVCVACGHKGTMHNSLAYPDRKNWACWQEIENSCNCTCNCFVPPVKLDQPTGDSPPVTVQIVSPDNCMCGHYQAMHVDDPADKVWDGCCELCPCTRYRAERASILGRSLFAPGKWEDVSPKCLCSCDHEAEYHTKNEFHPCATLGCQCTVFLMRQKNITRSLLVQ